MTASAGTLARRVAATLLGMLLLSVAFAAERALAAPGQHVLKFGGVGHIAAFSLAMGGLGILFLTWPPPMAVARFLVRAGISSIGAVAVIAAIALVLDPTFFGIFPQIPQSPDGSGAASNLLITAGAALLGLFGVILAASSWRSGA